MGESQFDALLCHERYTYKILFFVTKRTSSFSCTCRYTSVGRYSDLLRVGRSEDRIPVGTRFSAPVQTGPGAPIASIQWVPGHFWGYIGRGVALTTHPLPSTEFKKRVGLYRYSPLCLHGLFRVNFTLASSYR